MKSRIRRIFVSLSVAICTLWLTSCGDARRHFTIGVSQCSEDSWRTKLMSELEQSTYFNEDVRLVMRSANDDVKEQRQQIQELVDLGVDLLIVSPQQTGNLSDVISKVHAKDIPVILFDRKSGADNYTAFMGADNYLIGQMLGEYAASQLGGRGNIVEIAGEHGSSPAIDRHKGFNDAIANYPNLHVIGYAEGDWKQPSGERAMNGILDDLRREAAESGMPHVDCVFGGNDRMALGARQALEKYAVCHPGQHIVSPATLYLGVDALPTPKGGIENVRDGQLTVSAIYPTHGDELMQLALDILRGEPYDKETMMETSLVTQANARVLLMQHQEVERQSQYIKRMHTRVNQVMSQLDVERLILFIIIAMTAILSVLLCVLVRAYRAKHRLNRELCRKNDELNNEKAKVERQRDELEEQRDQLLDLTEKLRNDNDDDNDDDVARHNTGRAHGESGDAATMEKESNSFLHRFLQCIEERLSDSDLSVEDIGVEMCLSRVQLYRKIKLMTGKTPVEIIREQRLKRAKVLLTDTSLSVSEVAYRVGFSAPSYFTKCYKDYYGILPSGK